MQYGPVQHWIANRHRIPPPIQPVSATEKGHDLVESSLADSSHWNVISRIFLVHSCDGVTRVNDKTRVALRNDAVMTQLSHVFQRNDSSHNE